MKLIKADRAAKRRYSEYLASGSSREQLGDAIAAIDRANLSEDERSYVDLEVIPMLKTLFEASVSSRSRYMSWTKSAKFLGIGIAVMSMISSTQAVEESSKWIPLLIAGILGVVRELIQDMLRFRQPVLDWISARESYDGALGEVVHYLSKSDVYALISDRTARFLEFSRRVSFVNGGNERRIQQQLQTLLETRVEPSKEITEELN